MNPTDPTHVIASSLGRDELLQREWLLTNGSAAYSMGTVLGCNTRRYHGLLVAATRPPVGRVVALNQMLETLTLGRGEDDRPSQSLEFATCLFPSGDGLVEAPRGHMLLERFEKGLTVKWIYRWGALTFSRELTLHWHAQAATLRYCVAGLSDVPGRARLRLQPMLTLRDYHSLCHRAEHDRFSSDVTADGRALTVQRDGLSVTLAADGGAFEAAPDWWYQLAYPRDTYRGQGDREDAFVPGGFTLELPAGDTAELTLSVALGDQAALPENASARAEHLLPIIAALPGDERQRRALAIATDDFVVERTIGRTKLSTVLAGYPWFADWGRDTFIALRGLLLCTGRLDEARDVLRAFAGSLRDGLVPNRFDDYDAAVAHYNTVDGSLWFVHAGLEYAEAAGRADAWLLESMGAVLDAYARGTAAEDHAGQPVPIRMDADGLIAAGDDHTQLTWMDAACGGRVFTPRPGKCVEINALWIHDLKGLAALLAGDDAAAAQRYRDLAQRADQAFIHTFWSEAMGRLIDHVTPDGRADPALRPNQVLACSLTGSPLDVGRRRRVLDAISAGLLTPMGLRTLPADDPAYHAHYGGLRCERDAAYHQGTLWPWLMGPYVEGLLRAGDFSEAARAQARAAVTPLLERLLDAGLGQLHEIFDAQPSHPSDHPPRIPNASRQHAPRGCPAQAWSVAELVRILDLLERAPSPHKTIDPSPHTMHESNSA